MQRGLGDRDTVDAGYKPAIRTFYSKTVDTYPQARGKLPKVGEVCGKVGQVFVSFYRSFVLTFVKSWSG